MHHFLYLAVDLLSVILPFAFSFHPRIQFARQWRSISISIAVVAFPFLVWDALFTANGVWGFNDHYLMGLRLFELPLEELLFFVCIPYASVFTYACIGLIKSIPKSNELMLSSLLALGLLVMAIFHWDHWYTVVTFTLLSLFLFAHVLHFQFDWMRHFYLSYLAILPFFFLTNGILTGYFTEAPVVWYNDVENMGIRLGSIPVEDLFYGMLLLMLNVCLFEKGKKAKEEIVEAEKLLA